MNFSRKLLFAFLLLSSACWMSSALLIFRANKFFTKATARTTTPRPTSPSTPKLSDSACYGENGKSICMNGACEIIKNEPKCKCDRFFNGKYCEFFDEKKFKMWEIVQPFRVALDLRRPNDDACKLPNGERLCKNGGICGFLSGNGHTPICTCLNPYYGERCDLVWNGL